MKRKFKLITSVASLCLAIALMGVGVFAATAPSITVTGSVSFTASNVLATVSGVKGTGADTNWTTALTSHSYEAGTTEADHTLEVGTIALSDATATGGYKITITSDFDAASSAKLKITTTLPTTKTGTGYEITFVGDANWTTATSTGLAGGQSATVTVTATFDPAVASSTTSAIDFGMSIKLARA